MGIFDIFKSNDEGNASRDLPEPSYAWGQADVLIDEYNRLVRKYGKPYSKRDAVQNLTGFIKSNIDEAFHEDIDNGYTLSEAREREKRAYDRIEDPYFDEF